MLWSLKFKIIELTGTDSTASALNDQIRQIMMRIDKGLQLSLEKPSSEETADDTSEMSDAVRDE